MPWLLPALSVAGAELALRRQRRRRASCANWPAVKVLRCTVQELRNLQERCPPHARGEVNRDYERIGYAKDGLTARRLPRFRIEVVEALFADHQNPWPGRAYLGLTAGWGDKYRIGDVRVFDPLSLWEMDAVAFLFR